MVFGPGGERLHDLSLIYILNVGSGSKADGAVRGRTEKLTEKWVANAPKIRAANDIRQTVDLRIQPDRPVGCPQGQTVGARSMLQFSGGAPIPSAATGY